MLLHIVATPAAFILADAPAFAVAIRRNVDNKDLVRCACVVLVCATHGDEVGQELVVVGSPKNMTKITSVSLSWHPFTCAVTKLGGIMVSAQKNIKAATF